LLLLLYEYTIDISSGDFLEHLEHSKACKTFVTAIMELRQQQAQSGIPDQVLLAKLEVASQAFNNEVHRYAVENKYSDICRHEDILWPFPSPINNEVTIGFGGAFVLYKWVVEQKWVIDQPIDGVRYSLDLMKSLILNILFKSA
jgi:hypothetical protein